MSCDALELAEQGPALTKNTFEGNRMLTGAAIILATVLTVLTMHYCARKIMHPEPDERTRDLAGSVLFRISALHGLVLALVFASEVVEYNQLAFESAVEVNAISDAYYDADRYGEDAQTVRDALRDYLRIVPNQEWSSLGTSGELSPQAWAHWSTAYTATLDLEPSSARQTALRESMLRKIHAIAENRDLREHHAKSSLGSLFWAAALVGVLLLSIGYYPFPPNRDNVILLSVFAAYTGFILYTIFAMSNPYSAPAALEPILFLELMNELGG